AGRPRLAHAVQILLPLRRRLGVGAPERVVLGLRPIPGRAVDAVRADLHQRTADREILPQDVMQNFAGDAAGGDAHRGFARGGAPAAAIIADAVLRLIGEVGMAGAVLLGDFRIILGALIDILDDEADRRAGGHAFEHAGDDFDL